MITNSKITESTKKLLDTLSYIEKDDLYRALWFNHVVEDIESYREEHDEPITDNEISIAAERYVYDGDYDCTLDYWTNIENIITKVHSNT